MIKLACPHCRMVGMVPELLSETGGWPIACHHCHQHYFAPVLSGPLPMARLIELNCSKCAFVSQLDIKALDELKSQNFTLYCPECHDSLSVPRYEGTTETSLNAPASDTARQKENKQSVARPKDTSRQSEHKKSPKKLNLGGVLLLLLIGFVISLIMIDAAQQGIIDRTWLDMILSILPDKSQLEMIIRDIIAKGAQ